MNITFLEKQRTIRHRLDNLRKNATRSELAFKQRLEEAGVISIFQKAFIQGNYYCIVDFYLPRPNRICIEIDGGYHNEPLQQRRDARKDAYLTAREVSCG